MLTYAYGSKSSGQETNSASVETYAKALLLAFVTVDINTSYTAFSDSHMQLIEDICFCTHVAYTKDMYLMPLYWFPDIWLVFSKFIFTKL